MNRWTMAAFLLLEALPASAQGSKAEADRAALLKTDTEWARTKGTSDCRQSRLRGSRSSRPFPSAVIARV